MIDPLLKSPPGVAGTVRIGAARPVAKAEPAARRNPEPLTRPPTAPQATAARPASAPTTSFAAPSAAAAAGAPQGPAMTELADLRSAARNAGYEDGKAAAQREFATLARTLNEQFAATLAGLHDAHQRLLEQLEQRGVDIAFAATVKVFGELSADPVALRRAVQAALQQAGAQPGLQVHLNPADAHMLNALAQDPDAAGWRAGTTLCPDASVRPGGCIIGGAQGDLDAGIETQLASLGELLLQHRQAARDLP